MKQTRLNLGSFHRHHGDDNKPKTHTSNTAKQHLQEKPSTSKQNNKASPEDHRRRQEEEDCNLNPNRKQSVITKVKEKAMKWRQTLAKKKHLLEENEDHQETEIDNQGNQKQEEDDPSPSRAPALGDDIKNPRPIRSSTNVHRRKQFPNHPRQINTKFHHEMKGKSSSLEEEEIVKTPNPSPIENHKEFNDISHTKTLAEAVTEKLAPVYNGASYELPTKNRTLSSLQELSLSKPLTVTPSTSEDDSNVVDDDVAFGVYEENTGVSVKVEPEEDERVLWEVIRKAILSPTMDTGDKGVMEKVKEVVTSLLQEDEEEEEEREDEKEKEKEEQHKQQTNITMQNTRTLSPLIPISTNAYEGEEESQERILQTN
ncbi:hypothetical protein V2J09_019091 [Rumex salicifolius]